MNTIPSLVNKSAGMIECSNCLRPYPEQGVYYRCQVCGGIFDYGTFPTYDPQDVVRDLPGIWRYRPSFALPEDAPVLTLGEGDTPLIWVNAFDRQIGFKLEYLNPTGSHKDRGVALMTSMLLSKGVTTAVEDSSGNAGASFAAYAARAGVGARIFIPDYASGPKRAQIEAYGAEVVRILGRRTDVAEAVRRAADEGAVYASHAYLPHLLPGYATIAYELFEEMGESPGTVVVPAGHGSLLLGLARGFENLHKIGAVNSVPNLVGVQAMPCAPLWALVYAGPAGLQWMREGETIAEGVRVIHPLRGDTVLKAVASSGGTFVAVEEEEILPGRDQLARRGLYVEPTSAVVWDALRQIVGRAPEPIVALLTGSGYKYEQ